MQNINLNQRIIMERHLPAFRINSSVEDLLDSKELSVLKTYQEQGGHDGPQLIVSGRPLHIYDDESEAHFSDCPMQLYVPVHVGEVALQKIPYVGHGHLSPEYLSEEGYPILKCFVENGTELVMGARSILGFEIQNVTE
jgi:hypothetical protein